MRTRRPRARKPVSKRLAIDSLPRGAIGSINCKTAYNPLLRILAFDHANLRVQKSYQKTRPSPPSFEYKQGMNDKPISVHPETGQPVRRVITDGLYS